VSLAAAPARARRAGRAAAPVGPRAGRGQGVGGLRLARRRAGRIPEKRMLFSLPISDGWARAGGPCLRLGPRDEPVQNGAVERARHH